MIIKAVDSLHLAHLARAAGPNLVAALSSSLRRARQTQALVPRVPLDLHPDFCHRALSLRLHAILVYTRTLVKNTNVAAALACVAGT